MTPDETSARVDAIIPWLESEFPASTVSTRGFASALTPVFSVVEGYVETQLEVRRPVFEEAPETLTGLLEKHRIPDAMKAHAGKRILVLREQETIRVDVESVRTRS